MELASVKLLIRLLMRGRPQGNSQPKYDGSNSSHVGAAFY